MTIGYKHRSSSAFTIVELLVVIVVIGILAAITIVSYTGISSRATVSSLQSDLTNALTQLKLDQVTSSSFPTTLALANGGKGIPSSSGTSYTYAVSNTTTPQTFCITATKNNISYNITGDGNPQPGICPVLNLDAGDISSYPGTGTTWTDLSGNGNSGTLNGGVTFLPGTNGGVLSFDGVDDYVINSAAANLNNTAFTIGAWVNPTILRTQGIAHKWSGSGWRLFMSSTAGTIEFDAQPGEIANVQSPAIPAAVWTHVVGTYDGTSAKIYTNGILRATVNGIASMFGDSNFGVEVSSTEGARWSGKIGIVNVYNRALSSDEVNQSFNIDRGRYGI